MAISITHNLWIEYKDQLLGFIKKRVSDPNLAEDLLQELFVRVAEKIDSVKDEERLVAWLYQIARNLINDHYRKGKAFVELGDEAAEEEPESGDLSRQDLGCCLNPMIQQLPEKYRLAIVLSELEGVKQREVAESLGITLSGAKSRIQRGRTMIKDMMLQCCSFEKDHQGKVIDFSKKSDQSDYC